MSTTRLCRLDDIPDGGSAGFIADFGDTRVAVLAIRQGSCVHVYENSCPHIGSPLDFQPGQFLDVERRHIICSTHGALFRIEDGHCISGPCAGDNLTQIKADIRADGIYLTPA